MKIPESLILLALGAFVISCGPAQEEGGEGEPRGTLNYEPSSDEVVLELNYEGGMIKDPDPTPFVRVLADGRVLVHYPAYMKKAGDYVLELPPEELDELLTSFADEELLTLESDELATLTAEAKAAAGPIEAPDTHGLTTVLKIRADSFTRAGEDTPRLLDVDHEIAATDLAFEAEALPELRRLQDLAQGVKRLEELAERPELRRLKEGELQ